jgi:hypothetical protein
MISAPIVGMRGHLVTVPLVEQSVAAALTVRSRVMRRSDLGLGQ